MPEHFRRTLPGRRRRKTGHARHVRHQVGGSLVGRQAIEFGDVAEELAQLRTVPGGIDVEHDE